MAEMMPGQMGQPPPQQPQGPDPRQLLQDVLMRLLSGVQDPKGLQMLGQGANSLMKVGAALTPQPSPEEQAMQPGPMQQLAQLMLMKRQREMMEQAQQQQGMPRPIPQPMPPQGMM